MSLIDVVRRRVDGTHAVDPWGLDPDLVSVVDPLLDLRWSIALHGAEHLPAAGPAVLVASRRVGVSEPLVLARALRRRTGRSVRFLGVPDVAPVGPALRRLGGAIDHPAELAALLRAGHAVAVPLGAGLRRVRRAGHLDPELLAPALQLGVPVLPVAMLGSEVGRRWRVIVGPPVAGFHGAGPLALAELAEGARAAVQALLDDATPPRWLVH